ncbi:hypothetical protein ACS0TY_003708 [Phlomoides rotata]
MAPARGFTAKEIDKNLFSFHFTTEADLRTVLNREPWLFEKSMVMLRELGRGEKPSALVFNKTAFWVRIYELPMAARNRTSIALIAGKIGDVVEVDSLSLEGFSRSVRAKVNIDLQRPLLNVIHIELGASKKIWIEFKYEKLPSFCYLCGTLGHLRKECDLAEGEIGLDNIPETKLPFGDWMRASPMKQAAVSTKDNTVPKELTSARRRLFEKFKQSMEGEGNSTMATKVEEDISLHLEKVAVTLVSERVSKFGEQTKGTEQEMMAETSPQSSNPTLNSNKTFGKHFPPFIERSRENQYPTSIYKTPAHNNPPSHMTPLVSHPHKSPTPTPLELFPGIESPNHQPNLKPPLHPSGQRANKGPLSQHPQLTPLTSL